MVTSGAPAPIPESLLLEIDEDRIRSKDPEDLVKVLKDLVKALKAMYMDMADAINLSPEYEKNAAQPLPAEGRFLTWEKESPDPGEPATKLLYNNAGMVEVLNRTASDSQQGMVELATDAEAQAMTDAARSATPANLAAVRATDVEAQAKTQDKRFLTPKNLAALGATTELPGLVELATDAEASAGTDETRCVNPKQLGTVRSKYAKLWDQQSAGTHGGTFTSGDDSGKWGRQRVLNQEYDPGGIVTLSNSQFTLGPGTYRFKVRAPAYAVDSHKIALVDIAAPLTSVLDGSTAYTYRANNIETDSCLCGEVVISNSTTYEIRHKCYYTVATTGFGPAAALGKPEIYTEVEIWKAA